MFKKKIILSFEFFINTGLVNDVAPCFLFSLSICRVFSTCTSDSVFHGFVGGPMVLYVAWYVPWKSKSNFGIWKECLVTEINTCLECEKLSHPGHTHDNTILYQMFVKSCFMVMWACLQYWFYLWLCTSKYFGTIWQHKTMLRKPVYSHTPSKVTAQPGEPLPPCLSSSFLSFQDKLFAHDIPPLILERNSWAVFSCCSTLTQTLQCVPQNWSNISPCENTMVYLESSVFHSPVSYKYVGPLWLCMNVVTYRVLRMKFPGHTQNAPLPSTEKNKNETWSWKKTPHWIWFSGIWDTQHGVLCKFLFVKRSSSTFIPFSTRAAEFAMSWYPVTTSSFRFSYKKNWERQPIWNFAPSLRSSSLYHYIR